ncbi:divergent polysaccharide deacetylase family protein [Pseudoroseicyclus aestuarii]|uniref:Polysaccharide deacetylase 2 family uncharacterized protein YibQ n=1 Tax=Pseudoroseicyclus aestuarii TaxID=1795041 RepID=A0A318SMR8_9RHOB|nr:divergent polysaccharide deacetylase family protein [Pseudoroseicyclus aestuarii]PYE81381.1 polysaccharide deacetylase 2 family uncharacterized protein YibQ [Pseudoroseicyclus aestuarii]
MARGFLAGAISGLVLGGVVLAVASLSTELPAGVVPPAPPQQQVPEAGAGAEADAPPEAPRPVAQDPVSTGTVPRADVPAGQGGTPQAQTDPAAVPSAGAGQPVVPEQAAPPLPDMPQEPQAEEPVLPSPQSRVPQEPGPERAATVTTAPTRPAAAPAGSEGVAEAEEDTVTEIEPEIIAPQEAPKSDFEPEQIEPEQVEPEQTGQGDDAPPRVIRPDAEGSLPDGAQGVRVRRPGSLDAPLAEDAAPAAAEATDENAPALQRHAAPAPQAGGDLPLMALVLIDDGSLENAVEALVAVPMPVSIAIDPARPGAAQRMQDWRAAGFEVAVLATLPTGARPEDVEVTYEAAFTALPQTVAVLDAGGGGLSADSAVTAQALQWMADSGRGLVTVVQGLATPLRLAREAGVPAAEVYRDLDGQGQNAQAVERFLDQAAFRAGQQGPLTVLGRVRPETITALEAWAAGSRAGEVALVPVSALLQRQQD